MKILISLIDPPAWDSRVPKTSAKLLKDEDAKIASLAEEFNNPAIGQLTAIEVEKKDGGRFERVFGSRRIKAAKLAGWKEIEATVKEPTPAGHRIYRNIVENAQRQNLTTFETARACAQLKELGLSPKEIGPKVGQSDKHAANLITLYKGLPPAVLKAWEEENPVATFKTLHEISTKHKSEDDKLRAWDDAETDAKTREAETGAKPGKRGKSKKGGGGGLPVNVKRLEYLLVALSGRTGSPDLENSQRNWGKALLDFVVLARENPPTGVPKMPAKGEKEEA